MGNRYLGGSVLWLTRFSGRASWSSSLGSTTYAFATMLAAFLFGIAIGSIVFARWVDGIKQPVAVFGVVQLGIGLFALILMPAFEEMYGVTPCFPIHLWWKSVLGVLLLFPRDVPPHLLDGGKFSACDQNLHRQRTSTR